MKLFKSVLSLSCIATAPVEAHQVIGFDDAPTTADDQPVKGVSLNPAKVGEDFAAEALGTIQVTASGVIAKGSRLMSAAEGRVKVVGATPANAFAQALTDANDGELVEILIR